MPTVTAPPAALAKGYYTKYLDANGIPILGAPGTSDDALIKVWELVTNLSARLPAAVFAATRDTGTAFATFPIAVKLTDLPEFQDKRGTTTFDGRLWDTVRGIGGPTVATGEEVILNLPGNPYDPGENIALHEFAHNIMLFGIGIANPALDAEINADYTAAIAAGRYVGTYAGSNAQEYWAMAVQAFFDQTSPWLPSANAGVTTRAELQAFDPALFTTLGKVFTLDGWRPGQFFGGLGDDTFGATADADYVFGGAGNDRFISSAGADYLEGAGGADTVDYSASPAGLVAALFAGFATGGDAAGDTLIGIENLTGTAFADSLTGNTAANVLTGLAGNDLLFAGGFSDQGAVLPASGDDSLIGGDGNDGLWGFDGNDSLDGGAGDDGIVAGAGADSLSGADGVDVLFGGDFSPTDGSFLPGSGNDSLEGGDGGDGLWGFDGDDLIAAGGGDDYAEGGQGADSIQGGAGNDTLLGQGEADTISGGAGFDFLYGGGGADTFRFALGDSFDVIWDFQAEAGDRLSLDPRLGAPQVGEFQFQQPDETAPVTYTVLAFANVVDGMTVFDQLTVKGLTAALYTQVLA